MREIKFRAWDNVSKKIVAFNGRKWCPKYGQHINIQYVTEKEDTVLKLISKFFYGSDLELSYMQYTGLKDINGVEIYEGDIVKRNLRKYETIEKIFTITMLDLELLLKIKNSGGYGYEVVGNIYENKELLA